MTAELAPFKQEADVVRDVGAGAIRDEHRDLVARAVVFIQLPIHTENGKGFRRGSGFITEVEIKGQRKCLLITCNHVLQSQSDALNADISFGRVGDSREGTIIKGKDLFHDFFKTDDNDDAEWRKRLDYTAVEVRKGVLEGQLKEDAPKPLSVTQYAKWKESNTLSVGDQLYIVHYPREQGYYRCTNGEHIHVLQGPYIGHIASANPGSSGSPMLREHNNKWMVVGLHRGAILEDINVATHIDLIVDDIQGKLYTGSVPDKRSFLKAARERADGHRAPLPSGALPFSVSAFLKTYKDEFLKVVNAKHGLARLKGNDVIPASLKKQIEEEVEEEDARYLLFEHLEKNATLATLRAYCDIASTVGGYPQMKELVTKMKDALPA